MAVCLRSSEDVEFHAIVVTGVSVILSGLLLLIYTWYKRVVRGMERKDIAARQIDDSRFWSPLLDLKPDAVCPICLASVGGDSSAWGCAVCCGTAFHKECVRMHFRHQNRATCPICRNV